MKTALAYLLFLTLVAAAIWARDFLHRQETHCLDECAARCR